MLPDKHKGAVLGCSKLKGSRNLPEDTSSAKNRQVMAHPTLRAGCDITYRKRPKAEENGTLWVETEPQSQHVQSRWKRSSGSKSLQQPLLVLVISRSGSMWWRKVKRSESRWQNLKREGKRRSRNSVWGPRDSSKSLRPPGNEQEHLRVFKGNDSSDCSDRERSCREQDGVKEKPAVSEMFIQGASGSAWLLRKHPADTSNRRLSMRRL